MAETFKNAKLALTTSSATIYTCPSATTAIVLMAQVANIDGTNEADATISWIDSSDSSAETYLLKGAPIPGGSSLGALSGKMILETGDSLKGFASADSDLVVTVSLLEMS